MRPTQDWKNRTHIRKTPPAGYNQYRTHNIEQMMNNIYDQPKRKHILNHSTIWPQSPMHRSNTKTSRFHRIGKHEQNTKFYFSIPPNKPHSHWQIEREIIYTLIARMRNYIQTNKIKYGQPLGKQLSLRNRNCKQFNELYDVDQTSRWCKTHIRMWFAKQRRANSISDKHKLEGK